MRFLLLTLVLAVQAFVPAAAASRDAKVTPVQPVTPAQLTALQKRFGPSPDGIVVVSISAQHLYFYRHGKLAGDWPISSSMFGIGNRANSNQTPLGVHRIAHKFGAGAAPGTLFRSRRNTGRRVKIHTDDSPAEGDYVTTRIMWLEGLEPGVNKGPGIDSFKRYIYIHGTPEEGRIGRPASHGCIRMRNADVIKLFDDVAVGTLVDIVR